MSMANTDFFPKVIEYLSKKGYSRTEAMLRLESANQDAEGKPIPTKTEEPGGVKYTQALGEALPKYKIDSADTVR